MELVNTKIQHQLNKCFYYYLEKLQLDMPWKIYDMWDLVNVGIGSVKTRIGDEIKYGK